MDIKGGVSQDMAEIHGDLSVVLRGDDGESAYEIAVRHGYKGTEREWLESLKGEAKEAERQAQMALSYSNQSKDKAVQAGNYANEAKSYRDETQELKNSFSPIVDKAREAIRAEKEEAEQKKQLVDEAARQANLDRVQADADAAEVRYLYGQTIIQKNVATDAAERARQYAEGASTAGYEAAQQALATKLDVDGTAANAEKVNNHTVNADVPGNAVFTDTTYEKMTASEASTGTGTTGRVISAKVLADFVKGVIEALVNSAPGTLDTLKELADAIGNDPNFAQSIATALSGKLGKNDTAVNAEKVNNHTVNSDVPVGAVFTDTTYSNATTSTAGLMSAGDKAKLNGIAEGAQVNTLTGVKGNAESNYRVGNVNITKANIGLGNVDNTADSTKRVAYAADAGTVNGFTVGKAVPTNAVFTDTTYSNMSASEANAGTSTTARTITAKVLADYVASCVAALVNSAPATLDTLKELSDALGNDPDFATTMTTALGNKLGKTETAVNAEKAVNVTGTVAIEHGGTGATTRLEALKNLTNEDVGTSLTHFLTITGGWGKGGYASVAQVKSVLGIKNFVKSGSTAEAGLVPAPSTTAGTTKYLREDGSWVVPPNTTYGVATSSANGLMSKTDKAILDAIPNSYATQAQVNQLATTATNSVSAAQAAKTAAETAKNQAQSIANGMASIRDTAVDTSLSISGQAADSKTVGDKFAVIGATSATNNEYLCVWLDSSNHVLFGVKVDGSFTWQKGLPKPVKDELDAIKSRLDALEA